ncbi:unnamed protein product [Closterium sp. Yama58-4]|nr:unnamed protein product [Closterium sp. Yama58-4]
MPSAACAAGPAMSLSSLSARLTASVAAAPAIRCLSVSLPCCPSSARSAHLPRVDARTTATPCSLSSSAARAQRPHGGRARAHAVSVAEAQTAEGLARSEGEFEAVINMEMHVQLNTATKQIMKRSMSFMKRSTSDGAATFRVSKRRAVTTSAAGEAAGETAGAPGARSKGDAGRGRPWMLVGLSNPGMKYEGMRHNVGFEVIDAVARAEGISLSAMQRKAVVGKGRIAACPMLLVKPQTFMNLSGESIYNDMDLDIASMKLLAKGGHGGHNGMKSIMQHFQGSRNFPRLRFVHAGIRRSPGRMEAKPRCIGRPPGRMEAKVCAATVVSIGRPPGRMEAKVYVLQKFSDREREEVDVAIVRAVDAVRLVAAEGMDKAVSTWNLPRRSSANTKA